MTEAAEKLKAQLAQLSMPERATILLKALEATTISAETKDRTS